ncbi:MAG: hypothetical protein NTY23_00805, partial [Chloroflexi bacterium]|nr:hypothetical protein [Chloroflexota bacterium]
EAAARLTDYIRTHPVEVVISHGSNGEYGHPGHRQANQAALLAVQGLGTCAPLLYGFSADFAEHPRRRLVNADDPADFVLDISPTFDRKLAAARCHRTQGALFVRRVSIERGHAVPLEEALLRIETLRCLLPASEPPGSPPADLFARWLRENLGHIMIPFTPGSRAAQG